MSKRVKLKNLGTELNNTLVSLAVKGQGKADKNVRDAIVITWSNIIKDTPVDTGQARGGWIIGKTPNSKLNKPERNKGMAYVESRVPEKTFGKSGNKLYLFNNHPYIAMLEYGGYGVGPKTVGGYSKQAPQGMIRKNLKKFRGVLKKLNEFL